MTENATAPRPVIVAGVDGSPTSREALRWAAEEARLRTATLRVVRGVPDGIPTLSGLFRPWSPARESKKGFGLLKVQVLTYAL
ncbi:universal stress protein [Streptomyces sp. NPDC059243]|uniref:universal stress protein n=1 Tax=Streptomyces sp. NPDC059243 TaxID=3346788 RepID=UPI0036B30403